MGQLGGREASGRGGERQDGFGHPAHARFVEVDAAHLGFANLGRSWELLQSSIRDEALIDAGERIHEALQDALQPGHDLGKLL
jgi:hypothetical protein